MEIPAVLRQIVEQSGLFDQNKLSGIKNPFTQLINSMDKIKGVTGAVSPGITSQIYNLLSEMGIKVFCATSED